MNKKILYAAILVVILVSAIAATYYVTTLSLENTNKITLTVVSQYGAGSIQDAFNQVLDDFMAKYPNIYVKHQPMDQTTFNTVMPIWLKSGDAPDVFQWLGGAQTQVFVDAGYLGDISSIYDSIKGDFSPAVQNQIMIYNGKPYAVPLSSLIYGCFYNKDIFTKYEISVPKTYDELLAACQTIKEKSGGSVSPFMIAAGFPWLADETLTSIMSRAVSASYMRDLVDGKASWTEPQAEQCIKYFSDLVPYLYPGSTELTDYDAAAAFARGDVAMEFIGPWRYGMILDNNAKANIGWFPTPSINSAYDKQLAAHSDIFVMAKDTPYPEESKLLLKYIASPEAQKTFGLISNQPVPNLKVDTSGFGPVMTEIMKSGDGATDVVMEIGLMSINQQAKNDARSLLQKLIIGTESYTQVAADFAKLPWGQPNT